MKKIYLLSPDISFKTYKLLQKNLVKDSGPTPVGIDKILWQLNRDYKIYCYFTDELLNDMVISLKLPKKCQVNIIK
jgi:hypothetical protein